jgi:16S rRNA (guanine966-N2)-methyltransferase
VRIIAGEKRGARLQAPPGRSTRPTSERVRASLMMILTPEIPGRRVLDLFAGIGGLGLEALSRGAARATFVEKARGPFATLERNIAQLGFGDRALAVQGDVGRFLGRTDLNRGPFDLIFIDPPYGKGAAGAALARLGERSEAWLAEETIVVAQVGARDPLEATYGALHRDRSRDYGETRVEFYRTE